MSKYVNICFAISTASLPKLSISNDPYNFFIISLVLIISIGLTRLTSIIQSLDMFFSFLTKLLVGDKQGNNPLFCPT